MAVVGTGGMHTVNSRIQTQLNQNLIILTFEEMVRSFYFFFFFNLLRKVIERVGKIREDKFHLFSMLLSIVGYCQDRNACCSAQNSFICSLTRLHRTIKLPLGNPMTSRRKYDHEPKNT